MRSEGSLKDDGGRSLLHRIDDAESSYAHLKAQLELNQRERGRLLEEAGYPDLESLAQAIVELRERIEAQLEEVEECLNGLSG